MLTLIAIDMYSSDMTSRTFITDVSVEEFNNAVEEWEDEIPYRRYELVCNELMDDYPSEIVNAVEELGVTN